MVALIGGLFGAGSGAAAAGGAAAGAAAGGISLTSILSGAATVLGIVSQLGAAGQAADAAKANAIDQETNSILKNVQTVDQKRQTHQAVLEAIGGENVAYGASGLDLSFGTAAQARKEAVAQGDLALTGINTDSTTTLARLDERRKQNLAQASAISSGGALEALAGGLSSFADISRRGY